MVLTLPFLVCAAALLYFLARHEGWLESWARRSTPRTSPPNEPGKGAPQPQTATRGRRPRRGDRLEVFEEFLSSLARDDSEDVP